MAARLGCQHSANEKRIGLVSCQQLLAKQPRLPVAMRSHKKPFTHGQDRQAAMRALDGGAEGAETSSFHCPELMHTILTAGEYM